MKISNTSKTRDKLRNDISKVHRHTHTLCSMAVSQFRQFKQTLNELRDIQSCVQTQIRRVNSLVAFYSKTCGGFFCLSLLLE